MKKYLFPLLAFILVPYLLFAQNDNADLLAQSPDGKTVKLIWLVKNVPDDFGGFDIKRKDGLGDWQKLNRLPLLPGISQKKSLADVETDVTEAARIREKLKTLIRTGKLQESSYNKFLSKWKSNDKEIQDITLLAATDFDVSLMCGFGYVDHTISQKTDYQYGLFAHNGDKLLARTTWNYGEIPDLNVVREITSRSVLGKNGVQLIWNVDVNKLRASYVAGFNVYKRGIRLNDEPIAIANPNDPSEYEWYDASAKSMVADQYSISTQSAFGIEGIIKSYTYNPADHPNEYKRANVTNVSSLGFYFKDGISIKWNFPKEHERFIKGFYIEKDNMPDGYNRVSDLISPYTRAYVDHTGSSVSNYIRIRVVAVYNDKSMINSPDKLYSYFQMVAPPKPQNLKATLLYENRKSYIRLNWDGIMNGDSITHHYKIYMHDRENNKYLSVADKLPVKTTSFSYQVPFGIAATYRFCMVGVTKLGIESLRSDTLFVYVPSTELPVPVVRKSFLIGNNATIQWDYPTIQDLSGFRLYSGETVIADETQLKSTTREYTTGELQAGIAYNFTLRAITEKGVISEGSIPVTVMSSSRKK